MMMNWFLGFFVVFCVFYGTHSSVQDYIGQSEKDKFASILSNTLLEDNADIHSIYYGSLGHKLLDRQIDGQTKKKGCDVLKEKSKVAEDSESILHLVSSWSSLGCSGKIHNENTLKYLRNVLIDDKSSPSDIRYALEALASLGEPIPNAAKTAQLLQSKLKTDDSLQSLGSALRAAVHLGTNGKFILDRVEDIVVQLDEVDGKLLQWEGGLSTTSLLLTGLLNLKEAKPFTQLQADKLANYLLTRKTVQTAKGVVALLEAAKALTDSPLSPVSIGVFGKSIINVDKPELKVRVSNILGALIKPTPSPIIAVSATRLVDDVVVLSKQPLTPGSNPTEFILTLRLDPDHYQIVLNVGSHSATLPVRVIGPVKLDSFEIGLADVDGTAAPRLTKLIHPNKLSGTLQADSSHLLAAKFVLSRPIHQTFLRLYSEKKEIIFIAQQDNNKVYKIEVNLNSEFSHSGIFEIELILGDAVMSNPIKWNLGKIDINLGKKVEEVQSTKGPKPEIKHLFRQAEKRPPTTVSLIFSTLTAAPLLLLLVLWLRIGLNFGNFSTISIPFHLGFGAILSLFLCFWLKLDMFTTCAWLIPLGIFTFLSGHKVLSQLASRKKIDHKKD